MEDAWYTYSSAKTFILFSRREIENDIYLTWIHSYKFSDGTMIVSVSNDTEQSWKKNYLHEELFQYFHRRLFRAHVWEELIAVSNNPNRPEIKRQTLERYYE